MPAPRTSRERHATILLPNCALQRRTRRYEKARRHCVSPIFRYFTTRHETEQNGNHPIKKGAALAALIAAFFYLLLSGAEVATQRSFIMTGIVLVAVILDRSALTLRNLALTALGVMLLAPEAVVHPSFPDVACS